MGFIKDVAWAFNGVWRGALWLGAVRALLSVRFLLVVLSMPVALVLAAVAGTVLGPWANHGVMVLWAYWSVPVVMHLLAPVVASHAVDGEPGDLVEPDPAPPPVSAYRRWWRPVLLASVVVSFSALMYVERRVGYFEREGWTNALTWVVPLLLAPWWSPFMLRATLGFRLPEGRAERSLKADRRYWWGMNTVLVFIVLVAVHGLAWLWAWVTPTPMWSASGAAPWRGLLQGAAWIMVLAALLALASFVVHIGVFSRMAFRKLASPAWAASTEPMEMPGAPVVARRTPALASKPLVAVALLLALGAGATQAPRLAMGVLWFDGDLRETLGALTWSEPAAQQHVRVMLACENKRWGVRLLWLAGVRQDPPSFSSLGCAAERGHLDMMAILLSQGADIDQVAMASEEYRHLMPQFSGQLEQLYPQADWLTPLGRALRSKNYGAVEWLLKRDAGVAVRQPGGWSEVHAAIRSNCTPCLSMLARHKRPLNVGGQIAPFTLWMDKWGEKAGRAELEQMLATGLNPAMVGDDGRSVLHSAAHLGNMEAAQWAVALHADPQRRDRWNMTPLMHAAYPADKAAYMGRDGADPDQRLQLMMWLLERTADVSGRVRNGPTLGMPWLAVELYEGWGLGMVALHMPAFRLMAQAQGKTLDYGVWAASKTPWSGLKPDVARHLIDVMSDQELSSALWPGRAQYTGDEIPLLMAKHGWRAEMNRALNLGLLDSPQVNLARRCALLSTAAYGSKDESEQKVDSWHILQTLRERGLDPAACSQWAEFGIEGALTTRNAAQRQKWAELGASIARP